MAMASERLSGAFHIAYPDDEEFSTAIVFITGQMELIIRFLTGVDMPALLLNGLFIPQEPNMLFQKRNSVS